jgi:hypothetical protein
MKILVTGMKSHSAPKYQPAHPAFADGCPPFPFLPSDSPPSGLRLIPRRRGTGERSRSGCTPCNRKMLRIAGDEVMRCSCLRAFQEYIVVFGSVQACTFSVGFTQRPFSRMVRSVAPISLSLRFSLGHHATVRPKERSNFVPPATANSPVPQ